MYNKKGSGTNSIFITFNGVCICTEQIFFDNSAPQATHRCRFSACISCITCSRHIQVYFLFIFVTNSQLDTTNESQGGCPAGAYKAHINRRAQRHSKHKKEKNTQKLHKRSTALERSI